MQIQLRDYQQECVDLINGKGKEGRHLIAMATGLGKTAVFSHIERRGRTLILSHRDELVRQPEKYYEGSSFGVEKAEEHADGEDVVSASVQSLARDSRLSRYAPDAFYTVIIDEAHHAAAPSYKKILDHFSGAKQILGVTATPKRGDGVRLTDVFDDILFSRDLRWGIQNSWLSSIRCERVVASYELSGIGMTGGDFNQGELDGALDEETLAVTAKTYLDRCHGKGRHTLAYCVSIRTCEALHGIITSLLPKKEQSSIRILSGKTETEERKAILEGFQKGSIRCIINCMVLTEGTDLPVCDAVINLRPTCNMSLYQQIVGRGTRLYDGKDYCLVIDIVPNDERKIRNLCTAPTLFGLEPRLLPKKVADRFNEENDLLELCDEIAGTIGTGADIAGRMEIRVVLAEAFIQGRTEAILGDGQDMEDAYKGASRRLHAIEDQELAESGLDFQDLYVTTLPEEGRRFLVRPNWEEVIYISTPDVLGNVTVDFHVTPWGSAAMTGAKRHYIKDMGFDEAVSLVRKYCMLSPENYWYSWNRPMRERWKMSPATQSQKWKLEKCYSEFGLDDRGLGALNKLEASSLIDTKMEMDQKASYVKAFKVGERQRQSTKDKKLTVFQDMEEQEQKDIQEGRDAFPVFLEALERVYSRREEEIKREKEKEQAAMNRARQEVKKGYLEMDVTVKAYAGNVTPKQDSFIQSLVNQASGLGYLFRGAVCGSCGSRTEASLMIEMLLYLTRRPNRKEDVLVFDTAGILREIRRVAGCQAGSSQKLKITFAAQTDGNRKR